MADPIIKFLARSTATEKKILFGLIDRIVNRNIVGMNAKKLVGSKDLYRVQKGVFRIIYRQTKTAYVIISVDRRSEKTYRDF